MGEVARGTLIGAVAIVLAASAPGPAGAQNRQVYEAQLTSDRPGAPTGFAQTIRYRNPQDAGAKPFAVAEILFSLPEGATIDTSVPPQCDANEAELQLQGAEACPPATAVGVGSLSLDFGAAVPPLPRVIENDVRFFNNEDELILFSESTNTGEPPVRNASRVAVDGRTFTSRVPPLPAAPPPDPFAAVKDVVNRLDVVTRGAAGATRAYITTPPTCPASGRWTISARFTYRDGVVETAESGTPCIAEAPASDDGERHEREDLGATPRTEDERPARRVTDDGRDEDGSDGVNVTAPGGGTGAALREGELPFTGRRLAVLAGVDLALLVGGLTLARLARRRPRPSQRA
jgi:hypothetical protein